MLQLSGKVAVVTGASSGIGEATAVALAEAGMHVVAVARRKARLEALAARRAGITIHVADVTDPDAVQALADRVAEDFGACNVLVNNAGASHAHRFTGPAELADVEREMALNYTAPVRLMAAFADLLRASRPARVINVASVAGKLAVNAPGYAASKFALVGFSEAVGLQWAADGVTVSQVNPGFVRTEGFTQSAVLRTPAGRLVLTPQMVASAIVEVAATGARERTVPRWYRPFVVLRHVAPPLYWAIARRVG